MPERRSSPDRKTVIIGRLISRVVARAPWTWPLISRSVMGFFDSVARGWDSRIGAGSVEHLAPLASGVLEISSRPERILDIGCGTGAATLFLAREYPAARIRGVDISGEMIEVANSKVGLDPEARVAFRTGDASKLPYPAENFDLVSQTNMPVFFAEVDRVLRPGGSVLIASSRGQNTPFSTPDTLLRRKFTKLGYSSIKTGSAANGTWFVARKNARP